MCEADEAEGGEEGLVEKFKPLIGSLVKLLKSLASSGYAPEHDVTGVADPFLQVKILTLLRVLARGDVAASEEVNDILAQVATNTDASKNVGNSILYETVLTILEIEADSGLRVLGVNILGKFLANKDNNIRYVALNTLIKVVAIEPNAVQRHRNTILECLRDPDISIRRRALDLSFTLINDSNVRVLVRELLAFLEVADPEFKPIMTSQIGVAADKFAPNQRWHIDTMLRVLKLAGNYVREQILSSFIRLITTSPDLQQYSVQKLYANLKDDITQEGLTLAAAWVIGEYGDLLLRGGQYEEEDLVKEVKESDIVDLFSSILNSSYAGLIVTQYIVTASMKLTVRFTQTVQIERLKKLLQSNQANLDVEIQQRAVEYGNLFGFDQIRKGVLEKMPPPEIKEEQRSPHENGKKRQPKAAIKPKASKVAEQDMLLDLMGGDDIPAVGLGAATNGSHNSADLLADILGGSDPYSSTTSQQGRQGVPARSNVSDILNLFDGPSNPTTTAPHAQQESASSIATLQTAGSAQPSAPLASDAYPAYSKNDLVITFQIRRDATSVQAVSRFRNISSGATFSGLSLQVAVPKSQKLQLQALANDVLQPGQEAAQNMRVTAAGGSGVINVPC